ncbi:hypothetical protein ACFQZ4_13345 [Catellatospora coxensis]
MDAITELLTSINDLLASLISIVLGGAAPGLPVDPSLPRSPACPNSPSPASHPCPRPVTGTRKGTFLTLRVEEGALLNSSGP